MTAIAINPLVVSVSPRASGTISRIQSTQHGGGGGLKKIVAVVAMVAIPIAAPAIASSIATSGILGAAVSGAMVSTAGAVVSSAIVGAGLGAVTAKVTGGDVRTGAISGLIGGGFGGYGAAQAGTFGTPQGGIQATANNTLGTNFGAQPGQTGQTLTGDAANTLGSQSGANIGPGGEGGAANLTDATAGSGSLVEASYTPANAGSSVGNRLSNVPVTSNAAGSAAAGTAKTAMSKLGPNATFGEKMAAYATDTGSALVNKVTDPAALANLTMQAGGQLLGAAMAPDPEMPPEQRQLLEERRTELAELKKKDEAAFNAQMDAAKGFLQQAQQYDPTYMAFQAANKEAIDQQRKLREQYRKAALSGGRNVSEAEKRRMSLDSARNVSSRYDQGFQQGLTAQNRVTQAGLSAIPNSSNFANYTTALRNLSIDQNSAEEAARQKSEGAAKNISDLFAGFNTKSGTGYGDGYFNSNKAEEEKNIGVQSGGLDTQGFTPFYQPGKQYGI